MGDEDLVFPCEELAYAIRSMTKTIPEIGYFGDEDLYERMHAVERRVGQVHRMVGARDGSWYGLKVPRHVNEAARTVYQQEGRTLYFGAESWRSPVFRAAVRANADPDWAHGFVEAAAAARALGGSEAELAFVHAEFPAFETAEDRVRRWKDERVAKEREMFEAALAQEDAA
jgi:hypothetical protein